MAIDQSRLDELLGRFVADLGAAAHTANVMLGERLGLYRTLAGTGPLTPAELAELAGTAEPYLRDWLRGQAAGGYVSYDPGSGRFWLSEEQAFALTDEQGPVYLPGAFQLAASVIRDEPRISAAIGAGQGFAWAEHDDDLFQGTRRFFRPGYAANLVSAWIPALDGVEAKLRAGARVADVGCGLGASTILLAVAYPNSTFTGFDNHTESIELARKAVAEAGLGDRVRFEVAPGASYPGSGYDLVASFDCLHDMGDPVAAAAHVRSTLAGDGTWLLVEPFANDVVEDNLNPVGRIFYGFSTMICVPHALAEEPGGPALGPQAGQARLAEVVAAGGFTRFRRATETPFNLVLEARP